MITVRICALEGYPKIKGRVTVMSMQEVKERYAFKRKDGLGNHRIRICEYSHNSRIILLR